MKLYTLGLYEKSMPNELSFREKLTYAREAGYDFLEMSIDETDAKLARLEMSKAERGKAGLSRTGYVRGGASDPDHVFKRPPEIPVGKQ